MGSQQNETAETRWAVVDDDGKVLGVVEAADRTAAEWAATSVPGAHDAVGVGVRPVRDGDES